MGTGIIVRGLNGSGKSTLGKKLAKNLGFHFIWLCPINAYDRTLQTLYPFFNSIF